MSKIALTDLSIQKLKPGMYFDTNTPAFGIRIGKHKKTWLVIKGVERRRTNLGQYPALSLKDARKKALIALGSDQAPTKAPTFDKALEQFLALDRWKESSKYQLERNIRRFFKWTKTLDKISHGDVAEIVEKIPKPGQRSHTLKDIKTFFNWCVPRYIPVNPCEGLKNGRYVPGERTLSPEELKAVWNASYAVFDAFGAIVRLLILTGARKGEIATLKWEHVTKDGMTFPETKNGRPRTVPVTPMMQDIIEKRPKLNSTPYLFSGKAGVPYNGWGKHKAELDEKTQVPDHTLHDLRRTFAHQWQRMGVRLEVTEAALGHVGSRGGIVGVYQTYGYEDELRATYTQWEQRLSSILGNSTVTVPEPRG